MKSIIFATCLLLLAACGGSREEKPPGIYGPGDVRLGQTVQQVESEHPGWTLEASEVLPNGQQARQYRDYHWTAMTGMLHSARHHTLFFQGEGLVSWATK